MVSIPSLEHFTLSLAFGFMWLFMVILFALYYPLRRELRKPRIIIVKATPTETRVRIREVEERAPITVTDDADIIAALRKLGYSARQAKEAAATIPSDMDSTEDRLMYALRYFDKACA